MSNMTDPGKPIRIGLWLTFFCLPLGTSPAVIASLLTIAVWVFSGLFVQDFKVAFNKPYLPAMLFIILPWAGLIYTSDSSAGMFYAKRSYYFIFPLVMASAGLSAERLEGLLRAFLGGMSIAVSAGVLQFFNVISTRHFHPSGFVGYIPYSLMLVFGMALASYEFGRSESTKARLIALGLLGAMFFNLMIIPGRSGYLAFVSVLPLMLSKIFGGKRTVAMLLALVAVAGLMFSSPMVRLRAGSAVKQYNDYFEKGDVNTSVGQRLYMWRGAVLIFLDHPIIGAGTGAYRAEMKAHWSPAVAPEYFDFLHPHNSYLFFAACYGIIGLSLLIWIYYNMFSIGIRYRDTFAGFAVLAFAVILAVGSLTDNQVMEIHTAMLFALMYGVCSKADRL